MTTADEVMDSIFKRRSVRQYTGEPVSNEKIHKLLEAGMSAPSAGNERPWHFIVVEDKLTLRKLADVSPYAKMLERAAVAIVVCGDKELTRFGDFWIQDCSAATENILIEAVELGLGAVWLGVYPEPSRVQHVREVFSLPENVVPFSLVPIGHPAEEHETSSRYDETRVHREKW
jgi:nitroreductase